jgi:hypothetical protein
MTERVVVGTLVLLALGCIGLCVPMLWPIPMVAGAVLIAGSFVGGSKPGLMVRQRDVEGGGMELPEVWDEQEIGLGLERYRGRAGLLGQYIDGIVSRFVMGQNMQTMEVRTRFLETFNKHATVARESYKWHRYLKGGRAKLEEDLEDMRLEIELQQRKNELDGAKADPELVELQKKARRVELLLQIAQSEKAIEDLNKPEPSPPVPTPVRSAREIREQKRATLEAREKEVREAIRLTKVDPTLDEEQKQRKLNNLDEKLAQLHEELTDLL